MLTTDRRYGRFGATMVQWTPPKPSGPNVGPTAISRVTTLRIPVLPTANGNLVPIGPGTVVPSAPPNVTPQGDPYGPIPGYPPYDPQEAQPQPGMINTDSDDRAAPGGAEIVPNDLIPDQIKNAVAAAGPDMKTILIGAAAGYFMKGGIGAVLGAAAGYFYAKKSH